ncbi:MAG: YeeE/YedE family protein [Gemmatimonadetes bacterium]|nr:YeeE/YedE family protein [Gemmatimonadota bacterium]NNM03618.1 YeeE/YedE family protein [Gemmatimonadota bacterium]
MESWIALMMRPWPWFVTGPLIGLVVPVLLVVANKQFGLSSNLTHMCAIVAPRKSDLLKHEWKNVGLWNLTSAFGLVLGGYVAVSFLSAPDQIVGISEATRAELSALGIKDFVGLAPREIFSFKSLTTARGLIMIVGGGFLVGFGARYAAGCTSGHGISGLSNLQVPSLVAVLGFFAGGFIGTFLILPLVL